MTSKEEMTLTSTLQTAALILGLLFRFFSAWFLIVALFFPKKPPAYARRAPSLRFACLLPARNEEAVIGRTVGRLLEQNYPPELFDVYVIPNNCTDGTEAAARAAGAKILRCAGTVRCKGDALRQAFARLLAGRHDAFCVFDADNLVDPDFLARMNDAFLAGARVAKGRLRAQNPYDSAVAGCYALYHRMTDVFFNRPRAALGLSARLVGTGFAVHRDVLVRAGGWRTRTIAEDAEFAAVCAEAGEKVWWVPEAVTRDESPVSFRVSLTQRKRWCSGIMSVAELHAPRLLRAVRDGRGLRAADVLLFLCLPFLQAFSLLPALLLLAAAVCGGTLPAALASLWPAAAAGLAGMTLFGLVLAMSEKLDVKRALPGILLFPVFMASWMPLQAASLVRRTRGWKEIRHGNGRQAAVPAPLRLPGAEPVRRIS